MIAEPSYTLRRFINIIALGFTALCALATISILFGLLGYIVMHGFSAINVDFLTKLPAPVGESGGGMANAIIGTLKLLVLAGLLGVPIGVLGGVYLAEFGSGRMGFFVRYAADILNGVPSIVMGIVAYTFIVLPMRHFSTLAGSAALAIMMIPIVIRSTEELLKLVPQTIREAGLALGVREWKMILQIVIPTALRGVVAGILLALARIAGETAPLLFTALNNRVWSHGWLEPTASLPVMIFTYSIAPYEDWHRQAWAAALILVTLVLIVNALSRSVMLRRHKETT